MALRRTTARLEFGEPVSCVYRPLEYAWDIHRTYLERYGAGPKRTLLLGMNPGPFGMVQTGVPFGEVAAVTGWLGLSGRVKTPEVTHPRRPVEGWDCQRSEVSGRRLWGLFQDRFGTAERFFSDHFVVNYCPLAFVDQGGRNLTPDRLGLAERLALEDACDRHLAECVRILDPRFVIGVGNFALKRIERVCAGGSRVIGVIHHPSPASPSANRDWAGKALRQLVEIGAWSSSLGLTTP